MIKKVLYMMILLLICANMIAASEIINLKINDKLVTVKTPLIKQNNEILVPISEIANQLGFDAKLEQNTLLLIKKEDPFEEVATLENTNIKLLARKNQSLLRDFMLVCGDKSLEFPDWYNVNNRYYFPKLFSVDLTNDGQEELVVILTLKKGNGMYVNDFHVFEKHGDGIKEMYHQDLKAEAQKDTTFTYTKKHLKINLEGKEILKILIPKYELPTNKAINLSLEHFVLYKIEKQKLKGVILVEQDYRDYIGSIIATYKYKNGIFAIEDMEFKRH